MWTCWTRSNESTRTGTGLAPSTDTVADHPESQATERVTVDGLGARTLTCSDLVVLDTTCTGRYRPFAVEAEIGRGGVREVKTAYPCEKPASCHGPGTSADDSDPPSS